MSIKPIDMQTIFPRVQDAAKHVSDTQQRLSAGQQSQAQSANEKIEHQTKQVHSQEDTQKAEVNPDGKGHQSGTYNRNGRKNKPEIKEEDNKSASKSEEAECIIDIRV